MDLESGSEVLKESLQEATISWNGSNPSSEAFQDIYFSAEDGLAETRHVFINSNNLEQRWTNLEENSSFTIAETGFGTGLNFLASCQLWQKVIAEKKQDTKEENNCSLHFVSFEKFPLSYSNMKKALQAFSELDIYSQALLNNYPKLIKGVHRLHFSDNIQLTLIFDDALEAISKIDCQVDAWFFDGFSPNCNSDLWSSELFEASKKLNKEDTTFATFTAAGHVKRKLQAIGFEVRKVKGFGKKREMLAGEVIEIKKQNNFSTTINPYKKNSLPFALQPWLLKQQSSSKQAKTNKERVISIIGAGLAGAWTAYKFAEQGWSVKIYDKAETIAAGASGNPRGATYFKPSINNDSFNNFYLNAYLYSIRQYQSMFPDNKSIWDKSGLLQVSSNERLIKNHKDIDEDPIYSQVCHLLNPEEANKKTGVKVNRSGLFFPDAGSIDPRKLCEALLSHKNITVSLNTEVTHYEHNKESKQWTVFINDQNNSENTEIEKKKIHSAYLVIANSYMARQFSHTETLPLHSVRGQTTHLESTSESQKLKTVICTAGYLTPAHANEHCIGSTFDPKNNTTDVLDSENKVNLKYLNEHLPNFYKSLSGQGSAQNLSMSVSDKKDQPIIKSAKAALRCQTPDNLPILGQAPNRKVFDENYSDLAKGQLKKGYPLGKYHPGLYLNLAHGSRGLISAPYCAELLLNDIQSETLGCFRQTYQTLSAARFYIRDIRKSKA